MPYQFLNRRQFDLIWYFYPLHGRTLLVGRTSTATSWRSSSLSPQLSLQILSLSNEDFVRGPVKCMQEPWCLLLLTEMTICSAEKNCRQNDSKWSLSLPSSLLELIWNDLERIISITWSGGITNVCNGSPYRYKLLALDSLLCVTKSGIVNCDRTIAWQIESSYNQVTRSTVHTVISPGSSLFRLCQLSAMGHCWWLRLFSEFLSEMSFLFKTISKGIAEIFVVSVSCWGGRYRRLLFTGQDFCKFCSVLDKIPHWPASSIDYYAKS